MGTKLLPITVRFSEEEKKKTERNAAAAGLSVSRFLAATGSKGQQPLTAEDREMYIDIIVQLKRIGTNINQLAATMNAARRGSATEPTQTELDTAGIELNKLIQTIKQKI